MKHLSVSNVDMFLVRGILAILFGIATLLMPGITLIVLVALFGARCSALMRWWTASCSALLRSRIAEFILIGG